MLPLKDTVPARSFALVNWLLIAANVVLFFVELSLGSDAEILIAALGVVPARLLGNPTADQLVTLVTSMFLHGG
jgi:membrane associated rhomboid family serine protease